MSDLVEHLLLNSRSSVARILQKPMGLDRFLDFAGFAYHVPFNQITARIRPLMSNLRRFLVQKHSQNELQNRHPNPPNLTNVSRNRMKGCLWTVLPLAVFAMYFQSSSRLESTISSCCFWPSRSSTARGRNRRF